MSTGTVQIPVLFDMSGDTIVFGEDGVGDFVSSHLDFLLDMTTEANDISLNAADISSAILIGDQDDGDSIFYAGGTTGNIAVDNLCNRIANAITRGKLVHIPKSGDTSNSGIPMGGRSLLYNASGQIQDPGEYAIKYNTSIAPIGDEQMLGQAMARVASVHLVGHPLSSGIFSDGSQTQTDLETASAQTFNSGGSAFYNALAVQLSKVLGGSKSSSPMNSGEIQTIYASTTVDANVEKIDFKDGVVEWANTATIRYKVINEYNSTESFDPYGSYNLKIYPIVDASGNYNPTRGNWTQSFPWYYDGVSYEFWLDDSSLLAETFTLNNGNTYVLGVKDLQLTNTTWANKDVNNAGPLAANVVHNGIANGTAGSKLTWTPTSLGEYVRFFDNANPGWGQNFSGGPMGVTKKFLAGSAKFGCALDATTQTNNWKKNSATAPGPFPKFATSVYSQYDPSSNDGQVYAQQTPNTYEDKFDWANTDPSGFVFHMTGTQTRFQFLLKPGNGYPVGGFRGLQMEFVCPATIDASPLISTLPEHCGNDISNTQFVYTWNSKWGVEDHNNYVLPAFVWANQDSYMGPTMVSSTDHEGNSYVVGSQVHTHSRVQSITMIWAEQFNPGAMAFGALQYGGIKKINWLQDADISNINQFNLLAGSYGFPQQIISPLLPNDINNLRFGLPQGANGNGRYTNSVASVGSQMGPFVMTGSSDIVDVDHAFCLQADAATTRYSYDYAAIGDTIGTNWDLTNWGGGTAAAPDYANYGKYLGTDGPTNTIAGPWIQIDLGISTLVKYAFCMTSLIDRLVVFGSNDDSTWTQLRDYDDMAGFRWGGRSMPIGMWGNNHIELNHNGVSYRYIRFVVNRAGAGLIGGISGPKMGKIYETYIFGIDPTYPPTVGGTIYPLDASGVSVPALKSIYEQLMNVPGRSQIMQTRDISGVVDNSNVTLTGGFPFIAGDKLVMYLRPKIVFSVNTSPVQFNELVAFPQITSPAVPVYNISDSAGTISTQTYTHSSGNDWAGSMIISANGNGYLGGGNGTGTVYWNSAATVYATNASDGAYIGSQSTTNVDGTTTLLGEWGQIDIGVSTWATELKMTTNSQYNGRAPREFKLLGSANGTNWTSLMHKTSSDIIIPWVDYVAQTFSIDSPGEYRYYKLVVIAIANSFAGQTTQSRTAIGHFELRGVKYPSEVVVGDSPTTQPNNQSILDISGLITNTSTVSDLFSDIFPGNATSGKEPEPNKWGWVGSANSDSFTLETTNETNNNTLDLHIWKITITL